MRKLVFLIAIAAFAQWPRGTEEVFRQGDLVALKFHDGPVTCYVLTFPFIAGQFAGKRTDAGSISCVQVRP